MTLLERCNIGNIEFNVNIYKKFLTEITRFVIGINSVHNIIKYIQQKSENSNSAAESSILDNLIFYQKAGLSDRCSWYINHYEETRILDKIKNYFNYEYFLFDLQTFLQNVHCEILPMTVIDILCTFFKNVKSEQIRTPVLKTLMSNCKKGYHLTNTQGMCFTFCNVG